MNLLQEMVCSIIYYSFCVCLYVFLFVRPKKKKKKKKKNMLLSSFWVAYHVQHQDSTDSLTIRPLDHHSWWSSTDQTVSNYFWHQRLMLCRLVPFYAILFDLRSNSNYFYRSKWKEQYWRRQADLIYFHYMLHILWCETGNSPHTNNWWLACHHFE